MNLLGQILNNVVMHEQFGSNGAATFARNVINIISSYETSTMPRKNEVNPPLSLSIWPSHPLTIVYFRSKEKEMLMVEKNFRFKKCPVKKVFETPKNGKI